MSYLIWLLRLVVFLVILIFAIKNTQPVVINFYDVYRLQDVPLIAVMLSTFLLGAIFGLFLIVPTLVQRRREAARLRRELDRVQCTSKRSAISLPSGTPEKILPLTSL